MSEMAAGRVLKLVGYPVQGKDSERPRYRRAGEIGIRPNGIPEVDAAGRTDASKSKAKDEVSVIYESVLPLEDGDLLEFGGRFHRIFRLRSTGWARGPRQQIADAKILDADASPLIVSAEDAGG